MSSESICSRKVPTEFPDLDERIATLYYPRDSVAFDADPMPTHRMDPDQIFNGSVEVLICCFISFARFVSSASGIVVDALSYLSSL